MEYQDQRKNHLPGHESHGVHLCHKCGWPFPNQHPSARHRRAHKRVCGTLEGYKLLDAEGAIHSDDEHLSDDDRKTPSPKFLERDVVEKGTVGITEGSTRQGDEKSLETGRDLADNVEKITKNDPEIAPSLKNGTVAGHLDDSSKMKKPEIPESMAILAGTIPKTEDHISSSTINAAVCSLSDSRKEESASEVSDDKSSAFGVKPIISETPRDVSQESDNIGADAGTANCSALYLGEETNAKEKEQTNLDRNYPDDLVSLTDSAGETSVAVPVVQKTEEIITDFGPADEILQLKEEHTDGLDTSMSISELSHKVDHVALGNSSIDASQIKDAGQGVAFASSGHSSKDSNGKEDDNENVFVLSLPDDITVVDEAENMIRGLRDMSSHQSLNLETCEMITDQKDDAKDSVPKSDFTDLQSCDFKESSEFSASEMSMFENDLKQQCGSSKPIEGEVPVQKDDAKDSVPKSDFTDLQSRDFNKSSVFSDSEKSVFENDLKQQYGSSKPIEGEVHVQKEDDRLQMKVTTSETQVSGDLESGVYALVTDRQKVQEVYPPEDKNPHDYCNQEKAIEKSDVDIDDNIGRVGKEDHAGSTIITDSATKFVSTPEENVSLKAEATPISLHEYQIVPDDVLDVSRMKLNVDCCHLSKATDVVPAECVGGTTATESHEVMDTELLQRDTKGQTLKGQPIPPSDAKSSVQNAAAVADNCDRDSRGCAGDIRCESLPGECVDNSVKQKFGTSTPDVSIDTSSQTDSLEGHWGSVSDITAITETGPFTSTDFRASAEAVTASLKNLQVTSEGQRSDKSEIFEPPSFMTLVEPRGSHVQTVQNLPHPETSSPQSGWFPSLTHVVNESQGRKKNEQIIAKVTNWSTGRQHAPLKSLLSEAKAETKPKSPNLKENPGIAATQTKVTSVVGSNQPTTKPAGKESNSPPDVKGEKKKVKGRPYWAQFVCCSSVGSKA
ncbi:uncharacterized protein LOC120013091 isoform X2 [Tripterygium wilfordii]|uniref:uncharacterized protein LOC120013091 isoform X2 n=1 Tax=Tripterygium wilfordii TaxID=458696 RepID=UPI0018F851F7|nr:uncharacterized protein LOC120013091 isoform X2 [Tripterygium wilfordii]